MSEENLENQADSRESRAEEPQQVAEAQTPAPKSSNEEADKAKASRTASKNSSPPAKLAAVVGRLSKKHLLKGLIVVNVALMGIWAAFSFDLLPRPERSEASPETVGPKIEPRGPSAYEVLQQAREEVEAGKDPVAHRSRMPQVSWKDTEEKFAAGDYEQAYEQYRELAETYRGVPANELVCDYFVYRATLCLVQIGRNSQARQNLLLLIDSGSPLIRALSEYEMAVLDYREEKYLSARSHAYRAIANLGPMDTPMDLEADCNFLIARALTEKVRSFRTTERYIPWPELKTGNPFAGLTRKELRDLLAEGSGLYPPRELDPRLVLKHRVTPGRWQVCSWNVTVEEFMNQFAGKADIKLEWDIEDPAVLRRPANFYFLTVSSQSLTEIATGMAGLIGRYSLDRIEVFDPRTNGPADEQVALLAEEASQSWRLFFFRHANDPRMPIGQFCLGAMNEWTDRQIEAANEYRVLVNRYERSKVAPFALLRCAKIKLDMMNFSGARRDLLDLLDLYPEHPGVDEVYLMLGRVYEKSAQIDEAARTYETLYHRNLSAKSRRASSYGAGRCHFRQENYVEASRWLVRYVGLATDPNPSDYADAYFLLARSEMARGNYDVAEQAIQRGLVGDPPNETAVPAMLNLAECHTRQEEFVNALGVMQELEKLDLTGEQLCQKALNTARLLREIGLVDKARNELRTELNQMNDPSQRGRIAIELARCHILGGDYESARQLLSQVMPDLRQGPELTEATVLMAEVSLLRGRPARAVQIAQPLLEGSASQAVRRKALRVIGEAYLDLKEYERAVMAFSGQNPGRWEDGE